MMGKNECESGGDNALDLFLKIGLDERTAKNTVANNKVTANLTAVIHEVCVLLSLIFFSFFFPGIAIDVIVLG